MEMEIMKLDDRQAEQLANGLGSAVLETLIHTVVLLSEQLERAGVLETDELACAYEDAIGRLPAGRGKVSSVAVFERIARDLRGLSGQGGPGNTPGRRRRLDVIEGGKDAGEEES